MAVTTILLAICLAGGAFAAQEENAPTVPSATPDGHFLHNFIIMPEQQGCPTGCKGHEGDYGVPGHRGPKGPPGSAGPPGVPGYLVTYSQGRIPGMPPEGAILNDQIVYNPWVKGPQGEIGDVGPFGATGADGQPGPQGRAGRKGRIGRLGEYGHSGLPGPKGDIGAQGESGVAGTRGPTGYPGARGPTGLRGPKGVDGFRGPNGLPGDPGTNGVNGDYGAPGEKGIGGADGPPGQQGSKGASGATGAMGSIGQQGTNGFPGNQGPLGAKGDAGVMGLNGNKGRQGDMGPKGRRGPYIEKVGVNETETCSAEGRSVTKYDPYVRKLYYCNGNRWQCVESDPCNRNCEVGQWEPWQPCSVTCGEGVRTRMRRVMVEAGQTGARCPSLTDTQTCTEQQCSCPRPSSIANGRATGTLLGSYPVGGFVDWQCNAGYRLVGASASLCLGTGQFDAFPSCQAVQCPDPGMPMNGNRASGGSGPHVGGTSLTHACNADFTLQGEATTVCQSGGTWSEPLPTCQAVQCADPGVPANGGRDRASGTVGDVVTFICNFGYTMQGSVSRTCQGTGDWSDSVPTCDVVNCGEPQTPQFGSRQGDSFTFGSDVAFSCSAGYRLVGSRTRHCQADGSWSGTAATCQLRVCPELSDLANGRVQLSNTDRVVGTTASFACTEPGYQLVGEESITCAASGTWTSPAPMCRAVTCCRVNAPENGQVTDAAEYLAMRDSARYTCSNGYRLNGVTERRCTMEGWSDPEPTCERITCSDPGVPANGRRLPLFGAFLPGEAASFTCEAGYSLQGSRSLTCGTDGRWNDVPPTCRLIICDAPAVPANGQRVGEDFSFGKTVGFTCDKDFTLRGSESRTCQMNGQFDGEIAMCDPDCVLSEFGDYTPCSVTCGEGTRSRARTMMQEPSGAGKACEPLLEPEPCNLGSCITCMNGAYSLGDSAYVTPPAPLGPYAADVVVVIEQSELLQQAFNIIRGFLETIETRLVTEQNIGASPGLPNMYTLVGFGGDLDTDQECAHYILQESTFPPTTAFTFDRIDQALRTPPLSRQTRSKDGYEAMLFALRSPGIRHSPNIAHNLIFIGNSSRTDTCGAPSDAKAQLRSEILRRGFTSNFLLDHRIQIVRDKSEEVLGVRSLLANSTRLAYLQRQFNGGFSTLDTSAEDVVVNYDTGFGSTNEDYTQFALSTGGVIWNVNNVVNRDVLSSARQSFTNAFGDIKVQEIDSASRSCKLCTCVNEGGVGQFQCAQQGDEQYCACRQGGLSDSECRTQGRRRK